MHIWLTDNNYNSPKRLSDIPCENRTSTLEELHKIADVNISNLRKDSSFFVFSNKDKIEDKNIISIERNGEDYNIITGNIAGFIGVNEVQLTIQSRFSKTEVNQDKAEEKRNDFFLHYMLSKVFNINLLKFQHEEKRGSLFDFLVFLFPFFLKRALRKGLLRTYVKFECDDSNIKGSVNVQRYLKKDYPFMGRIAYDKREYTADNSITELVRHTIEFIKSGSYSSIIFDKDVSANVKRVVEVTPMYDRAKRESVINRNLRPVRHPYYSEWTDLQRICLMILRHNKLNYAESKDKIYGIVFDVAWLWEEYLNTLLHPMGFVHPRNKENSDAIYLFRGNEDTNENKLSGDRYPDFYNDYCVLDAKYKRFETKGSISSIGRDDLHQMITYMYIINSHPQNGVFLFPVEHKNSLIPGLKLNGYGGTIRAVGHLIPQDAHSYNDFCEKMKAYASDFTDYLKYLNS